MLTLMESRGGGSTAGSMTLCCSTRRDGTASIRPTIKSTWIPFISISSPTRGVGIGSAILPEALEFKAVRAQDPTLAAVRLLRDLNQSGKRDIPADAPMPFRKDWKRLISEQDRPNRRLYETAVFATLRDKLRAGDVWVVGSSNYRRFDSYLLPPAAATAIAAELGLPATADEWLPSAAQNSTGGSSTLPVGRGAANSKASSCVMAACTSLPSKPPPRPKPRRWPP